MVLWKNIKKNSASLDENVSSSKRSKWTANIGWGVLAAGLVALAAYHYSFWRKTPIYREDLHAVAPRNFNPDAAQEANRLLLDFPTEIPGAAKVDRYITPDAQYCLVHIRQTHLVPNTSDEMKEEVAKVQADIYQILDYLARNKEQKIKGVYAEAVSSYSEDIHNTLADVTRTLNKAHTKEEPLVRRKVSELEEKIQRLTDGKMIPWEAIKKYPDDKDAVDKFISDLKKELEEAKTRVSEDVNRNKAYEEQQKEINKYDGVDQAAVEHGIKILAAEDLYANMDASFAADQQRNGKGDLKSQELILDKREDILLQYIAGQDEPLAVCVFGGAHAWGGKKSFGFSYSLTGRASLRDNIAQWNNKNPDMKFSLVEVTPASYKDHAKE